MLASPKRASVRMTEAVTEIDADIGSGPRKYDGALVGDALVAGSARAACIMPSIIRRQLPRFLDVPCGM